MPLTMPSSYPSLEPQPTAAWRGSGPKPRPEASQLLHVLEDGLRPRLVRTVRREAGLLLVVVVLCVPY